MAVGLRQGLTCRCGLCTSLEGPDMAVEDQGVEHSSNSAKLPQLQTVLALIEVHIIHDHQATGACPSKNIFNPLSFSPE